MFIIITCLNFSLVLPSQFRRFTILEFTRTRIASSSLIGSIAESDPRDSFDILIFKEEYSLVRRLPVWWRCNNTCNGYSTFIMRPHKCCRCLDLIVFSQLNISLLMSSMSFLPNSGLCPLLPASLFRLLLQRHGDVAGVGPDFVSGHARKTLKYQYT